jgi:hypothetical protein
MGKGHSILAFALILKLILGSRQREIGKKLSSFLPSFLPSLFLYPIAIGAHSHSVLKGIRYKDIFKFSGAQRMTKRQSKAAHEILTGVCNS